MFNLNNKKLDCGKNLHYTVTKNICRNFNSTLHRTKLKGMTFDHDFGYSFPLFSSLLKKREEKKKNEIAKIVIKSHAFQPGHHLGGLYYIYSLYFSLL